MRSIGLSRGFNADGDPVTLVSIVKDSDQIQCEYIPYTLICTSLSITPMPDLTDPLVFGYSVADLYYFPSYVQLLDAGITSFQPISYLSLSLSDATDSIDNLETFALSASGFSGIFYPIPPPP